MLGSPQHEALAEQSDMNAVWPRAVTDDSGQDLVEYALLVSCLGFAAVTATALLRDTISATYATWDAAGQSDALVEVPDPALPPP